MNISKRFVSMQSMLNNIWIDMRRRDSGQQRKHGMVCKREGGICDENYLL
jgi:hypothetical protein